MPFKPKSDFYIPGLDGSIVKYAGAEYKILVTHLSKQEYISYIPWLVNVKNKYHEIVTEKLDRILPKTNYILITTPLLNEGIKSYTNASMRMDGFIGIFRAFGGNNLLRQLVRDGTIDINTGNTKSLSNIVPITNDCEGPFSTVDTWLDFIKITNSLSDTKNIESRRIELSTQLIERAFLAKEELKFFNYWIAIEVAANTHSTGKIITLLSDAYNEPRSFIQNNLGFDFLKTIRTTVFHNGKYYEIPPKIERYIQCLFLDIVQKKLGLDCQKYMENFIKSGFDINDLNKSKLEIDILNL